MKAVHAPYQGSVKAVGDLTEGRFDFMFLDATVALSQIAAGKLKALAVTADPRPACRTCRTLTEFFPGLDPRPWMSMAAPADTPACDARRQLNGEINKAFADRDLRATAPSRRRAHCH